DRIIPRIAAVRRVVKADSREPTAIACAARVGFRKSHEVAAALDPYAAVLRLLRDVDGCIATRRAIRVGGHEKLELDGLSIDDMALRLGRDRRQQQDCDRRQNAHVSPLMSGSWPTRGVHTIVPQKGLQPVAE